MASGIMRSHFKQRMRSSSMQAIPPPQTSSDYSLSLARAAASILYRTPLPSPGGLPVYVLNAAAFPDHHEINYDELLPYVLARLPEEDELLKGTEYEVVFFAGGNPDSATSTKKNRPGWGWFIQAYYVLSRAMRKRLQKLYVVHEKSWVRILIEMFSNIISPKFRRKIVHASSLTALALQIPIEDLLIPPAAYMYDRKLYTDIFAPYASGRRAFGARRALPRSLDGRTRLPRVLRETTSFILLGDNIRTEGLFRISPNAVQKDVLREAYDRGQKFIVWSEMGTTLPIPPHPRASHLDDVLSDIDPVNDAYGVHLAASLIKLWYAELREPLFPSTCYQDLRRLFGNSRDPFAHERLVELFSPQSQWPMLTPIAREILTRHLIPLLATVSSHEQDNKMTPENLSICFAPTLVRGVDAIEDAKMSSTIGRILAAATHSWTAGLALACGISTAAFREDLEAPLRMEDYEDPLQEQGGSNSDRSIYAIEKQMSGIILEDNELVSDAPPLPPRHPTTDNVGQASMSGPWPPARKPALPLAIPPRYSTVITDNEIGQSPSSYAATTDGFTPTPVSGTSEAEDKRISSQDVAFAASFSLPKRKALTTEQILNASLASSGSAETFQRSRTEPQVEDASGDRSYLVALPVIGQPVKRKAVSGSRSTSESPTPERTSANGSPSSMDRSDSAQAIAAHEKPDFTKPTWAASTRKASLPMPTMTDTSASNTLASPVQPQPVSINAPKRASTLATPNVPKPRTPSPGLIRRIPSFDPPPIPDIPVSEPRRLDMRKPSVEDLRRLYEERAGTAKFMVRTGAQGQE
ncbi:hypothetical protein LTS18_004262 [Coniosporium uncinatum]|uniref:Uncharacterized protein n=1 Tax=Coniosporium uncinatum TaxID=93489 RepID=A0ACC3E0A7_9PEZI|nr:hypothetical protein LTS18_004262 [Coniosporium uncinatum]